MRKKDRFLSSKEWKELRKQALERDSHKCFLCGCEEQLCVHHIWYRRCRKDLQNESLNLITLCRKCHWLVHRGNMTFVMMRKMKAERLNQYKWIEEQV